MEIRSETRRYSKGKSKELKKQENVIQGRIEELDSKICNEVCLDQNILSEYEKTKKELQKIYEEKGRGAIFRSKARWTENGEKPTKYFFNLEKTRYEKKIVSQLKIGEDKFVSDFKQVNKEIENHYNQFYKTSFEENDTLESFQRFVEDLNLPYLEEQEKQELEGEINIDEVWHALNGFQNDKTPGDDGSTKEFYETFFDLLGNALLESFNAGFENGQLSVSQKRGIISLIPKDENNLLITTLSNWRPITLLNVGYKILAKAIAKRIESVLPKLIHSDQTGFIKERFIGQNVRLLEDLLDIRISKKYQGSYYLSISKRHLIL